MACNNPSKKTGPKRDLIGKVFGRLTVLKLRGRNQHGQYTWVCRCGCGRFSSVVGAALSGGHIQSCGCLNREKNAILVLNVALVTAAQTQRFWSNVARGRPDDCWPWIGWLKGDGYGGFRIAGKAFRAHRIAYFLNRPFADQNMHVLHKCDNPRCCNCRHLFLGTQRDNVHDAMAKGRLRSKAKGRPGEANHNAKLTTKQVIEIRRLWRSHTALRLTQKQLGRRFGVGRAAIAHIVAHRNWAHVRSL